MSEMNRDTYYILFFLIHDWFHRVKVVHFSLIKEQNIQFEPKEFTKRSIQTQLTIFSKQIESATRYRPQNTINTLAF